MIAQNYNIIAYNHIIIIIMYNEFAYIIEITCAITRPLDRNIQYPHLSVDNKPPQNTTCCKRCNGYTGNVQFKIS